LSVTHEGSGEGTMFIKGEILPGIKSKWQSNGCTKGGGLEGLQSSRSQSSPMRLQNGFSRGGLWMEAGALSTCKGVMNLNMAA
jgi:hypothetical protein